MRKGGHSGRLYPYYFTLDERDITYEDKELMELQYKYRNVKGVNIAIKICNLILSKGYDCLYRPSLGTIIVTRADTGELLSTYDPSTKTVTYPDESVLRLERGEGHATYIKKYIKFTQPKI